MHRKSDVDARSEPRSNVVKYSYSFFKMNEMDEMQEL